MPLEWRFLLDRGVNFRTKRALLNAGYKEVLQLADVGLTGFAKDQEIFAEAVKQQLILITKDTDFIMDVQYALGHYGVLFVVQSKNELVDTVTGVNNLAQQYQSLNNMRFIIQVGGQVQKIS